MVTQNERARTLCLGNGRKHDEIFKYDEQGTFDLHGDGWLLQRLDIKRCVLKTVVRSFVNLGRPTDDIFDTCAHE